MAGSPDAGVAGIVPGVPSPGVPSRGGASGNRRSSTLDGADGVSATWGGGNGIGPAATRLGPSSAGFRLFASEVDGVEALECDVTRWNTAGALTSAEPSVSSKPCASSLKSAPE